MLGGLVLGLLAAVGWYFLDCPPPAYQLSDDRPYPVYLPPRPYQVVCVDQEGLIRLRNFIASSFHRQGVLGQGHYGVSTRLFPLVQLQQLDSPSSPPCRD
ncbi:MAG: hypothetical protein ACK4QL_09730 [Pseudanabaenaceae cyanobacterium]